VRQGLRAPKSSIQEIRRRWCVRTFAALARPTTPRQRCCVRKVSCGPRKPSSDSGRAPLAESLRSRLNEKTTANPSCLEWPIRSQRGNCKVTPKAPRRSAAPMRRRSPRRSMCAEATLAHRRRRAPRRRGGVQRLGDKRRNDHRSSSSFFLPAMTMSSLHTEIVLPVATSPRRRSARTREARSLSGVRNPLRA